MYKDIAGPLNAINDKCKCNTKQRDNNYKNGNFVSITYSISISKQEFNINKKK